MDAFLTDAVIVGLAYLAALVFLFAAYRHAGRIWLIKHSIITRGADGRNCWRGEWGEMVIVTFAAISALVVIFFTNNVTLTGLLAGQSGAAVAFVAFVAVCIGVHSVIVVRKARAHGRASAYLKRLRNTYLIYNFYSLCLFGMGAIIVMMLAAQFQYDGLVFAGEARGITGAFAEAERIVAEGAPTAQTYGHAIAQAEGGFSRIALASKALQNQFNPLFVFAGTLIVINIAINLTKMKGMFTGDAVSMTALFTYGPLVVIGVIGLLVYLNVYEVMLADSLVQLRMIAPPPGLGEWEMSQRHAEMVVELSNARNIFGFVQTIAGEGGGFAILAWGIQTALEKISETSDEDQEPVRMPLKKFRPDDGRAPGRTARA